MIIFSVIILLFGVCLMTKSIITMEHVEKKINALVSASDDLALRVSAIERGNLANTVKNSSNSSHFSELAFATWIVFCIGMIATGGGIYVYKYVGQTQCYEYLSASFAAIAAIAGGACALFDDKYRVTFWLMVVATVVSFFCFMMADHERVSVVFFAVPFITLLNSITLLVRVIFRSLSNRSINGNIIDLIISIALLLASAYLIYIFIHHMNDIQSYLNSITKSNNPNSEAMAAHNATVKRNGN